MSSEKEQRNFRVQARWDELMRAGKHGHYETLFRVVREEVEQERERCAKVCEKITYADHCTTVYCAEAIRKGEALEAPK